MKLKAVDYEDEIDLYNDHGNIQQLFDLGTRSNFNIYDKNNNHNLKKIEKLIQKKFFHSQKLQLQQMPESICF